MELVITYSDGDVLHNTFRLYVDGQELRSFEENRTESFYAPAGSTVEIEIDGEAVNEGDIYSVDLQINYQRKEE